MVFLLSAANSLNTLESLQISLLGMAIVFIVLVALFALIRLLRSLTGRFEKSEPEAPKAPEAVNPPAQKSQPVPVTSGSAKLHSLDDKTAAMLLAIVADTADIPINELRVNSIHEIKSAPGVGTIGLNKKYVFQIGRESTNIMKYNITLNSNVYEVEVERGEAILTNLSPVSAAPTVPAAPTAPSAPVAAAAPSAPIPGGKTVDSPLPGTILNISVKVGDTVKAGQVLVVIEAMKMENEIPAPCDGRVAQILVSQGASVNTGAALISLE